MSFKVLPRTRERTTTTGTGDITVSGVLNSDNLTFAAGMGTGDTSFMTVVSGDGSSWEEFLGTYTGTNTIQRTTTITNHLGSTAHISLTGSSRVFAIIPSDFSAFLDNLLGSAANTFAVRGASTWGGATPTQAAALLPAVVGDTGAGGTKGLVPAPATGDAAAGKYLKADGTWATVSAGSGTVAGDTDVSIVSVANNDFFQYQTSDSKWHNRTVAQAAASLPAVVGDTGAGGTKGLVPAPATGDAAAGKFLKADGTWTVVSAGSSTVAGDTDVSIVSVANNDFFQYQTSDSKWHNRTAAQAAASLPAVVGDTGAGGTKGLVPAPATGDAAAGKFLKADGTWQTTSVSLSLDGLTDVTIASPVVNQVLAYNGTNWVNSNPSTGSGWHYPCTMATTSALPANTYSNGTAGVGATLTGSSNGALVTIDGVTPVVGYRVLVKDESNGTHNGIYAVTQIGDSTHPYILTRVNDFDDAGLINQGDIIVIGPNGTVNSSRFMEVIVDAIPIVFGTSVFSFRSVGVAYIDFTDQGAFVSTNTYTPGEIVKDTGRRYLNKVSTASGGVEYQWDSGYSGATNWTISGSNQQDALWTTGSLRIILGKIGKGSGKRYFEVKIPNMGVTSAMRIGLGLSSLSTQPGQGSDAIAIDCVSGTGIRWVTSNTFTATGLARGTSYQWFGFAVDLDNKLIWVENISAASGWFGNNGAGNPAAGTNGFSYAGISAGNLFVCASDNSDGTIGNPFELNMGYTAFAGTAPTGFIAYDANVSSQPKDDATHWIDIGLDDASVATVGGAKGLVAPGISTILPTSANTGLSTWLNQGSSSVSDTAAGIYLRNAGTGSFNTIMRYKAVPATPYTMTFGTIISTQNSAAYAGVGYYDGTNKLHLMGLLNNAILIGQASTPTTYSSNDLNATCFVTPYIFWRLSDDGTTITWAYSLDGVNFETLHTTTKSTGYLGATGYANVGIFLDPTSANVATALTLFSFS